MADVQQGLASWSSQVWPLLVNHLWQSTLFALALLPAMALLRRAPARTRYTLSLVASAKFLVPAALLVVVLARLAPDLEGRLSGTALLPLALDSLLDLFGVAPAGGSSGGPARPSLYGLLTVLWLLGAVGFAGRWVARQRAFARQVAGARHLVQGPEAELLERVGRRLGLRRRVGLALLPGSQEAGVFGVFRPVLVLPEQMPRHLTEAELEAIFLHELVHVRRRDNLVANLHMALCCLFWFHPLVWLLDRRLLAEREEACDERVLELVGRAETYARGLLKAVGYGTGWRLAGVSGARASNLRRRIERLLVAPVGRRASALQRAYVLASVALLFAFSLAAGTAGPRLTEQLCIAEARRAAAPDRCRVERLKLRPARALPEAAPEPRLSPPAPPPPPACSGESGQKRAARRRSEPAQATGSTQRGESLAGLLTRRETGQASIGPAR